MKIIVLILTLTIICPTKAWLQNQKMVDSLSNFGKIQLSDSLMGELLMHDQLSSTIDNYLDDAHVHLSSVANYDLPNPYYISILGGAPAWTHYYYNNIRIDNPLRPGDARYHFSMDQTELQLQRNHHEVLINPILTNKNMIKTNFVIGGQGGRVGFADWFINNISGHESAKQREIFPIKERMQSNWSGQYAFHHNTGSHPFRIQIASGIRKHLDQNFAGTIDPYNENYLQAYGQLIIKKSEALQNSESGFLFGAKFRSHDLAEFNYSEEETRKSKEWHLTYYNSKKEQNLAFHFDHQNLRKNSDDFTRNIIDQDGEGMEPYYQDGSQYAFSVSYHLKKKLNKNNKLNFKMNLDNSLALFRPKNNEFQSNIFRQSSQDDYASLHTISWETRSFNTGVLDNIFMLNYNHGNKKFHLEGDMGIKLSGILLRDNTILDSHPQINFSFNYKLSDAWSIGLNTGYFGNSFTMEEAKFLSKDYLIGNAFYWTDGNVDRNPDPNEVGLPAFNLGGTYRQKDESLGISSTILLEIPIKYENNSGFRLSFTPQYRQFRNTWHTQYRGDLENYGDYSEINGQDLFYLNPFSGITNYEVVPYPNNRIQADSGNNNGFLFKQPFYAGLSIQGQKQTSKLFFSASFTANMVVGASGFGNGPLHNGINVLSESTADPNLIKNNTGRLDADRSFISRWILGYKVSDQNRISFILKYKDGQSFANYDHYIRNTSSGNQIAFIQREVRGDNPLTGVRGRREDFLLNLDVKYQHTFDLSSGRLKAEFHCYNLLDFGNEILEYTFGNQNGFDRAPLELQVPRSILLQIRYLLN